MFLKPCLSFFYRTLALAGRFGIIYMGIAGAFCYSHVFHTHGDDFFFKDSTYPGSAWEEKDLCVGSLFNLCDENACGIFHALPFQRENRQARQSRAGRAAHLDVNNGCLGSSVPSW